MRPRSSCRKRIGSAGVSHRPVRSRTAGRSIRRCPRHRPPRGHQPGNRRTNLRNGSHRRSPPPGGRRQARRRSTHCVRQLPARPPRLRLKLSRIKMGGGRDHPLQRTRIHHPQTRGRLRNRRPHARSPEPRVPHLPDFRPGRIRGSPRAPPGNRGLRPHSQWRR